MSVLQDDNVSSLLILGIYGHSQSEHQLQGQKNPHRKAEFLFSLLFPTFLSCVLFFFSMDLLVLRHLGSQPM